MKWRSGPFEDVFALPLRNGITCPTRDRGSGVKLINMKEIFAYDRIADPPAERAPLTVEQQANFLLEEGDLLFARQSLKYEGAGKCSLVLGAPEKRTWEGHLIRARLDRSKADSRYYYYYFRSPEGRSLVETIIEQVAAAGIRGSDLKRLVVPIPPVLEQRAIAETLAVLDDKIDASQRIASTLETLIAAELSAVRSNSWIEVNVSALAEYVNGGAYTKGATGKGRMVIRIAELNGGPGSSTVYNELSPPEEKIARPGDVLMSWSGSLGVYRWARSEAIINQHIFKVICSDYPSWLVYAKLHEVMPEFRQIAADKATTMGHIKRHHLEDTRVQVPDPQTLSELDRSLDPMWDRLIAAEVEALTLAEFRDALLPELLSGRLHVRGGSNLVEEAV